MSRGTDVRTGGPAQPEPWRQRLERWRAHRKLRRGQCEWCRTVLPDTGSVDRLYRVCSKECAREVEFYRMI